MKTGRNLIVVDDLADWSSRWTGYQVISAEAYFTDSAYGSSGYRIVNLCRHERPLSTGYFISLLAEARRHRVMATARTLHNLSSKRFYGDELNDLETVIRRSLAPITGDTFTLSVYFGTNLAERHARLAQRLFFHFPCPLFRAHFAWRREKGWEIRSLKPLGLSEVPPGHLDAVKAAIDAFLRKRWTSGRNRGGGGYDLAILHNPEEKHPPSDRKALQNFLSAGKRLGLNTELITRADYPKLLEFDGLFLRETTSMTGHTYRFAAKAQREGMAVIDDPDSIRRCCNKVYLHELLRRNRVPTPRTAILHARNLDTVSGLLGFPLVVKIPDSAFSLGVFKINDTNDLRRIAARLFKSSDLLLAQEFVPTEFDWRVGVLNGDPLFVCRYYMTKEHWQIYHHRGDGEFEEGDFDAVAVDEAPHAVLATALSAAALIGDGLYGVDLKQHGPNVAVIEVNDNPNVETGVEDCLLGERLYARIMRELLRRIEQTKHLPGNRSPA